ncbi:YqcI/YcgG family protein [Actinoallomurus acaciae]|uniref:YqcI/YcgG family protein n=1 Tax=Actinoallomurus acaciae TaxID=502577 RepID=A0ABV5YC98_9ACTN
MGAVPDLERQTIGDLPDWGRACAEELMSNLLVEKSFPCTFAVAAAKKHTLRFGFIDSEKDPSRWGPLPDILGEYLRVYQDIDRETSLVVFFRPEEEPAGMSSYFSRFWDVLQYLHRKDTLPWPGEIPEDPGEPLWEFSFGGTPIFVVCNTPAHTRRRSRHSSGMVITFQPRWVFEGLESGTPRGGAARRVIRNRIRRFDGMEPAPQLGDYGAEDNREWKQYFLPDGNEEEIHGCPFHSGTGKTRGDRSAHHVVVNGRGEYSLWPDGRDLPPGWWYTGVHGDRRTCLDHIERVWTGIRLPARKTG